MSSEHPNSTTPRRIFPKPISSAFGSTGSLQRKVRGLPDKNNLANNCTPETPLKSERSKFIIPSNLSPFALSPKLLMARTWSLNKSTELRNESFLNANFNSESFDSGLLNSPSHFSSSMDDTLVLPIEYNSMEQDPASFIDKISNFCSDYEIDSSSISPSVIGEFSVDKNLMQQTEPWKSAKVNFLNNWDHSENAFGNGNNYNFKNNVFSLLRVRKYRRFEGALRLFCR